MPYRTRQSLRFIRLTLLLIWMLPLAVLAGGDQAVQKMIHMLDYIGVDYGGAVRQGRVISPPEYQEQIEFAAEVRHLLQTLPEREATSGLLTLSQRLEDAIEARASVEEVAHLTRELQQELLKAYSVRLAPRAVPDPELGRELYAQHCSSCHGPQGRGDGPLAAGLPIAPSDFHDRQRHYQRSLLGYFNTITLGLEGTPMRGYASFSQEQRWALAFHVGGWLFSEQQAEQGRKLWAEGIGRDWFPDLQTLVEARPAEVERSHGEQGLAVLAWLRRHPGALSSGDPLEVARERLARSLELYREGRVEAAYDEALAAYLEGFELAETALRARAPGLVRQVEESMLAYREMLRSGASPLRAEQTLERLQELLREAQSMASSAAVDAGLIFTGALVILLREGMEAILLIVLIAVTVVRAGRPDALKYIHLGWLGALLAGVATWVVSNYFLRISGAGREVTEGLTALLATVVLLYVGLWLHDKAHASRWQHFLRERIHGSLDGGRVWLLTGVVFLAAYREVFETILFYQVLWMQSAGQERSAMLLGIGLATLALLLFAWLIWQFSARLPLRLFFNINAVLLFVLAVVFAGKGIAALQEAGLVPATLLGLPRIDWLGIYPTLQGIFLQFLILLFGLWWFFFRKGRTPQAAG